MHSFLIVGSDLSQVNSEIDKLLKKLAAKAYPFNLSNIEDVRDLFNFSSLKFSDKTGIVIKEFDKSSTEAQNAFLKSLEEPGQNLYYILTSTSIQGILPTIISRSLVINLPVLQENNKDTKHEVLSFINLSVGQKLDITSKIKKREDSIEFLENLIKGGHQLLIEGENISSFLQNATNCLKTINLNGNIQLQLTNFIANIN